MRSARARKLWCVRARDVVIKSWKLTRKQFRRCCGAAYEELKR